MITNILLFLVASILFIILAPIGLVYGLITRRKFGLSAFFKSMAIGIDQLGNTFAQYLFDDIMITSYGYKFGNEDETISYVLGINKKAGTLTKYGRLLCKLLDIIQKNHCLNSIKK